MDLSKLQAAVSGDVAGFRSRVRLQPAGGEGDKVFPPTYKGAVYALELRRLPGFKNPVRCVLMDSVQSQANRIEEALQDALDEKRISLPVVEVDFSGIPIVDPGSDEPGLFEPIGCITSLQTPHRVADAILRDSEKPKNGENEATPFRNTEEGRRLSQATLRNATPLFEICPTALVLGIWDSTGPKGGLGFKFQRALVSEIIGVDASLGVKTSSRIDPLAIKLKAGPIYEGQDGSWTPFIELAKRSKKKPILVGKEGKPSEVNHGNIPPTLSDLGKDPLGNVEAKHYLSGGVTIAYAEQTTVLSLPALRRLKFPVKGEVTRERNLAAQTALAALGLCGAALANERGLDLRSRCLLWPVEDRPWELLGRPGSKPELFRLSANEAVKLLEEAVKKAESLGLPWLREPFKLVPSDKLVQVVRQSQELAVASKATEEGE